MPAGGTAVGTGINTHPEFGRRVAAALAQETGVPFVEAVNHFEANAQRDGLVECHGQLRTIATTLFNVANNIRWLGSGPRCGFYELKLPDRQPGSSIMPGKVNPVMCESMMQVCARVMGNDQTIAFSGATGGQFQLNIMMPVMGARDVGKRAAVGQRDQRLRRLLRRRNGSQRRSLRGVGRKEPGDGHEPESAHRLRKGARSSPKKRSKPARRSASCAARKHLARSHAERGTRPVEHDRTARVIKKSRPGARVIAFRDGPAQSRKRGHPPSRMTPAPQGSLALPGDPKAVLSEPARAAVVPYDQPLEPA